MSIAKPLTEEEMQRRIEQVNHSVSAQYMQLALKNQYLRADVRELITKALTIHNLNAQQ